MSKEILSKSEMSFKLKDGNIVYINDLDIKAISEGLWTQIIMHNPRQVFMLTDVSIVRAKELYIIYKNEKNEMSKALREKCLTNIIELLDTDFDVTTLQDKVEKDKQLTNGKG